MPARSYCSSRIVYGLPGILGIALARLVLDRGRSRDQRRVHDGAAAKQLALRREMLGHRREHGLRQVVALQQVAEIEDRRLVGDRVEAEFKPAERPHRLDIVERFLSARIGQRVPLLQAVDAQHHREGKRTPPALQANFGIMRLDHRRERRPRHHGDHLRQEQAALGDLFLAREIKRRKAQLVHGDPPNQIVRGAIIRLGLLRRFLKQQPKQSASIPV